MNDRLDRKKIRRKATIKILDKLTQEARQLAIGVNCDTKHKLNSNKGVITNKLAELKQLDNEIMDLSTDEEEITNIIVASTEFEFDPANIRLDEDVFRLRLQKTSSTRLQHVLVKTNIFVLAMCLQGVFKTSSRPLQDVLKTSSRCLQDFFKTFCKDIFKTFSRRTIKLICST